MYGKKYLRTILDILEVVVLAFVFNLVLRAYVVEAREIPTPSMLPSIQLQDRVVVDKISIRFREIKRGDIVVFHPPAGVDTGGIDLIKRVIGTPGDKVEIKGGKVYINDKPLHETYLREKPHYTYGPIVVPPKQYFVMGDNRNDSNDSHYWGTLPQEKVVGRAFLRYWPLTRFGALPK